MGIDNQHNEYIMESKDYELVRAEVELVIFELNSKQILSRQDQIEIKDHFYCDIEDMVSTGLSTREALLVARSRFGELKGIREDFEVVKPEVEWIYYCFIGVLFYSILKSVIILTNFISLSIWMSSLFISNTLFTEYSYLDIPFRILVLVSIGWAIFSSVKRKNIKNIHQLWFVPLIYLGLEVGNRILNYVLIPGGIFGDSYSYYGIMHLSNAIIFALTVLIMAVFSSIKLYKVKKSEYRFL